MALDLTKPVFRVEYNLTDWDFNELQRLAATNKKAYDEAIYTYLELASSGSTEVIASVNGTVVLDETE